MPKPRGRPRKKPAVTEKTPEAVMDRWLMIGPADHAPFAPEQFYYECPQCWTRLPGRGHAYFRDAICIRCGVPMRAVTASSERVFADNIGD